MKSEGGREPGMALDETATPALSNIVTLNELPPADSEVFDKHFALLDERDHGGGHKRPTPDKKRPVSLEETRPATSSKSKSKKSKS